MQVAFTLDTPVVRTARVKQLEGLFDLPPSKRSEQKFEADLPIEAHPWNVGLIVGPSGCGKSTLARQLFPADLVHGFDWPADRSLVDAFPASMGIKDVTQLLSSVGFSSPPSWLRPFRCLSNGEQFRVTIARALAEQPQLAVIDEFTSVVDRTVAQVGSAAVAKAVRRSGRKFVAVACHYDIIEWLDPDWIYEPASHEFTWRLERQPRPPIKLTIERVHPTAWTLFHQHHYLDGSLSRTAKCFMASIMGRPAAFTAVMSFPHPISPSWREHRTVCLPDFQGVGIGNAMSELIASVFIAAGRPYTSTTGNPAMITHRLKSDRWHCHRKPGMVAPPGSGIQRVCKTSIGRITAGFRYVGPPAPAATVDALLGKPLIDPAPAIDKLVPLLQRHRGATAKFLARKSGLTDGEVRNGLDALEAANRVRRVGAGSRLDPHSFELITCPASP